MSEQPNHPCAGVCSGWQQGFERGQSDREYHGPSGAMIIEENKRLKAELLESQARELKLRAALEWYASEAPYLNAESDELIRQGGFFPYGPEDWAIVDDHGNHAKSALSELSLPAPDLVGVIKVLSEALEDIADDSEERGTVETANWVLNMTREIRERIGAV